MSIAVTLRQAAQLQDKIEGLRGQLAVLLDKARLELADTAADEIPSVLRRGVRKKVGKGKERPGLVAPASKSVVGRGRKPGKIGERARAARTIRTKGRSPLAGVKRAASPSGPLAPAVVKVLNAKHRPMNVRDILHELTSSGYKFNSPEPKKNLAARIYRLKGVKQVSAGLFAAI